ncbi:MAG: C4-type zinc ribbon domain-containing protein [Bacteroidales bacterium]|nr:C4-type zinc ribbon domain-containing protein [Bacteroidales bacterium]
MATKKTKKIEAPIDQRETFVSIQKTFADSDLSVEEKLKTLYELQQVDTKIDKILQLRGELPLEVEALQEEIAVLQDKAAEISAEVDFKATEIARAKNDIVDCQAQIDKYKAQVDNVSNSREYDSLQKEIENQDLLLQIAQKQISEAKEATLALKQDLEVVKEKLAVKEEDLKIKEDELSTIVEATSAEEKKLVAERDAYTSKIDERTLSAYDRIRQSNHNHLAVVPVYRAENEKDELSGSCGGCLNSIPAQRLIDIQSNKKMIICEYCGRILVNPDFE